MLSRDHYELIAKYSSAHDLPFNEDELSALYSLLNLTEDHFKYSLAKHYQAQVAAAVQEQNIIMTELCGEFSRMGKEGMEIDAYRYLVKCLNRITSVFMLDALIGMVVGLQQTRIP